MPNEGPDAAALWQLVADWRERAKVLQEAQPQESPEYERYGALYGVYRICADQLAALLPPVKET